MRSLIPTYNYKKRQAVAGYLFVLPAILGLLIWIIGPMIASLVISFTDWNVLRKPNWIGFTNYVNLFTKDLFFKKSLMVTVYFAAGNVVFTVLWSLVIALLLNQDIRGKAAFRTIFYLPSIVPLVA
ncbi:unnamed protein product, partial [marine sediment metagenome]